MGIPRIGKLFNRCGWLEFLVCSFGSSLITFYDKYTLKDFQILACELKKKEILAKKILFDWFTFFMTTD
jgi:hypothetical protein